MSHAAKFAPQAQNAMTLAKWGRQAGGGLVVGQSKDNTVRSSNIHVSIMLLDVDRHKYLPTPRVVDVPLKTITKGTITCFKSPDVGTLQSSKMRWDVSFIAGSHFPNG